MSTPAQTIVVSSKNPNKIKAAHQGFMRLLPATYEVRGISVPSEVPDQPFTDAETLRGAMNRVRNARAAEPDADFWVGIEGGVHVDENDGDAIQSFAWVVVTGKGGRTGKARTSTYYLAEETAALLRKGMELGHADDEVFGKSNSKHHSGSVGLLTDDVIDRRSYYEDAVILALIPFKNPTLSFK
jgi:inosine/xanthosine triphosphatase